MKSILLAALLWAGLAGPVWASFEEGKAAYDRGNYTTAFKEFLPLAEQGDAGSQYYLGYMYDKGLGVPQDYVLAHMWFNLAASKGNKPAQKNRTLITKRMTPNQIAEAQRLAREWMKKQGVLGKGLDIRGVKWKRTKEADRTLLVVSGIIANVSKYPRPVPWIQVILYDSGNEELRHLVFPPKHNQVAAGQNMSFKALFKEPPAAARRLEVTFTRSAEEKAREVGR